MSSAINLDQFNSIVCSQESFSYANDKIYTTSENNNFKTLVASDNYPKGIDEDVLNYYQNLEETRLHIQEEDQILLRRLFHTLLEKGLLESINTAAEYYETNDDYKIITLPAFYAKKTLNWLQKLPYKFQPLLEELHSNYTTFFATRDWKNNEVRYILWHPLCTKLAVVTSDDSVNIFHCVPNTPTTILRGTKQKCISCLSWRPYLPFHLAVGTNTGVVLWKIDPNSIHCRPSMSNATILSQSDVTNVLWNNSGSLLISCSTFSGSIFVWNCELNKNEKVWCSNMGVNLITWALGTHYLFSSGIEGVYKVWDTCLWTCTQWRLDSGIIQTACWSPCGTHLIFATTNDPVVYTLNMNLALSPTKSSVPLMGPTCLVEMTDITLSNGDICGGLIQHLQLSPNGSYLAVMFKNTNYIAVCKLNISCAIIHVLPCFLFSGLLNEQPACMDFQKECKDGALLTVAWSSSRIQHIPIN